MRRNYKNNQGKKYISYKQYMHLNLNEIQKKIKDLEKSKYEANQQLSEIDYIYGLESDFLDRIQPRINKEKNIIDSLCSEYENVFKEGKNAFSRFFFSNIEHEPKYKNKLELLRKNIEDKVEEIKQYVKKEAEIIFKSVPTYSYLIRIKNDEYERISSNFIENEIKYCESNLQHIGNLKKSYQPYNLISFQNKEIFVFYEPRYYDRNKHTRNFLEKGYEESRKIIQNTDMYLKAVYIAKDIIEKRHNQQEAKINRVRDEADKFKAHAYAHQQKTRELSEEIKKQIKGQETIFPVCPYCEGSLGLEPHADHIYPVSLGGQGTKENMVYVCAKCNQSKGSLTLREYINKNNLNRERVENHLSLLGKKF